MSESPSQEEPIVLFKSGKNALGTVLYWYEFNERALDQLNQSVFTDPEGAKRHFLYIASLVSQEADRIRKELES